MIPLTLKLPCRFVLPITSNFAVGAVLLIPILPALVMRSLSAGTLVPSSEVLNTSRQVAKTHVLLLSDPHFSLFVNANIHYIKQHCKQSYFFLPQLNDDLV